jgi:hypothetical protein
MIFTFGITIAGIRVDFGVTRSGTSGIKGHGQAHCRPNEVRARPSAPAWPNHFMRFWIQRFSAASRFVNAVARRAGQACHQSDIDIHWKQVSLTFTTPAAGGLTEGDFALARQSDQL